MASATNIEWTDFNWNPLSGCSRKSAGCENCYAEKMTKRLAAMGQEKYQGLLNAQGRFNGVIKLDEKDLVAPLRWKKPRRVFVNSMSDLFHEKVKDEWLDKAFAVMALTPQHTYQILTKRPERMREYLDTCVGDSTIYDCMRGLAQLGYPWGDNIDAWQEDGQHFIDFKEWPLPNVWLGVSVEDQKTADERIPLLLQTPAAVRWISAEPLLGPLNLRKYFGSCPQSKHVDGLSHGWLFDGDDPYVVCSWCGERRDNLTGRTIGHSYTVKGLDWVVVGGES